MGRYIGWDDLVARYRELGKVDKDVLRITGEGIEIDRLEALKYQYEGMTRAVYLGFQGGR